MIEIIKLTFTVQKSPGRWKPWRASIPDATAAALTAPGTMVF
jgi:hypothetical protein